MAAIVLVFQALLLAHGGLTTLGANIFSMGIVGPVVAWLVFKGIKKIGWGPSIGIFFAALLGNWLTYITTALQLSLAFPIPTFGEAIVKFMVIFAYTQVPLAIAEGLVTVVIFDYIKKRRPDILKKLKVIGPEEEERIEEAGVA